MAKRVANDSVSKFTKGGRTLKKGDLIRAAWSGFFVVDHITPFGCHSGDGPPQVYSKQVAAGNGKPRKASKIRSCAWEFCYPITSSDRKRKLDTAISEITKECDYIDALIREYPSG